jgi:hypothetical protein
MIKLSNPRNSTYTLFYNSTLNIIQIIILPLILEQPLYVILPIIISIMISIKISISFSLEKTLRHAQCPAPTSCTLSLLKRNSN